ncbi:MAG: hypothetical protein IJ083_00430 [Clostridia bacterium]|nr:hypothetical protein [Clostridia bacterium]
MDNIANVYDLLNQDAEFARQVMEMHKSVSVLQEAGQGQMALYERICQRAEELEDLVSRAEGQLNELRAERANLQEDIRRHEAILEEMQRLEESFQGAVTAYQNISGALEYFEGKVDHVQKQVHDLKEEQNKPPRNQAAKTGEFTPVAGVDYEEVTTIENLYSKYAKLMPGPVVVVRKGEFSWSSEYCMAIRNISKGNAWGTRYSFGKPCGKKPAKCNEADYSMYTGKYYDAICRDFQES